jgi:hypothetical protein
MACSRMGRTARLNYGVNYYLDCGRILVSVGPPLLHDATSDAKEIVRIGKSIEILVLKALLHSALSRTA